MSCRIGLVSLLLLGTVAVSDAAAVMWRPILTASAPTSRVAVGETLEITYSTQGATSCQFNITQWGQWIGWSDGVVIPTSGVLQITPALEGRFVVTITAFRRLADLNRDGKSDGRRRSVSWSMEIVAGNAPESARPVLEGKVWFDPPRIRLGESTVRHWVSSGGIAYLDGQRVPASGSDVLIPKSTLTTYLQVTAGRRWRWAAIDRATVIVDQ